MKLGRRGGQPADRPPRSHDISRYVVLLSLLYGLAAGLAAGLVEGGLPLEGRLYDLAVRARGFLAPRSGEAAPSPVAVILLDDRSLDAPEMASLPRVFLSPIWGSLLRALGQAGASAIGFDFIFQYGGSSFLPDYDAPFLQALEEGQDRIVLGRTIRRSVGMPYYFAGGADHDPYALGLLEVVPDADGVFRRVATSIADVDGTPYPTLVAAMLAKAGHPVPAGQTVLWAPPGPMELAFPVYSLIDLLHCAEDAAGQTELRRLFAKRLVVIGTGLPDEDRKVAADRMFPVPWEKAAAHMPPPSGCLPHQAGLSAPESGTIPGVLLHAAAIDALWRGRGIATAPRLVSAPLTLLLVTAAGLAVFRLSAGRLSAGWALLILGGGALALFLLQTLLLAALIWLPLAGVYLALPPLLLLVRFRPGSGKKRRDAPRLAGLEGAVHQRLVHRRIGENAAVPLAPPAAGAPCPPLGGTPALRVDKPPASGWRPGWEAWRAYLALFHALRHLPRPPVRDAALSEIHMGGVRALPLIGILAALTGMVVVLQMVSSVGANVELSLRSFNFLVVGELAPVLVGLIMIGRNCATITADLAGMQGRGEFRLLERLGVDPTAYLVLPRFIGVLVATVALTVYFDLIALLVGLVTIKLTHDIDAITEIELFRLGIGLLPPLHSLEKAFAFGLLLAGRCCRIGRRDVTRASDIPRVVSRSVVGGLIYLFLWDAVLTMVLP